MKRRVALGLISLAAGIPAGAGAQMSMPMPMGGMSKLSPMPTAAEQPFIAKLQAEIPKRFATVEAAEKAGYFQYTGEDQTGAISYVNLKYGNAPPLEDPSQLWYDVKGRLLGVDYTFEEAQYPKPPATIFGYPVAAARYTHRGAHMHYGVKLADGTLKLGGFPVQKFVDAGGTPSETQPDLPQNKAAMVKAGLAQSPDQVQFVFLHPAMWDLVVWVLPNPDGAFAEANPNVKPSHPKGMM